MKKMPGYIIILHKCTKNHDHMPYWHMVHDKCNCYFSFWTFLPFYLPNSPKNQNFKKMIKTPGYIIILHKCTKNHDHLLYCFWDMAHDKSNCYFSFWFFFALLPPLNSPKNQNFKKMKKKPGDIIILHVYQKLWLDDVWFLRHGVWQTDGQADGKSDIIEVGAPPKNLNRGLRI